MFGKSYDQALSMCIPICGEIVNSDHINDYIYFGPKGDLSSITLSCQVGWVSADNI